MAFAQSKPIGLIEGPALLELVQSVQAPQAKAQQAADPVPKCHVCSRPMVRRVARKGFRKGEAYWECAGYPHCKGTRLDQAA
jgi:restriction system protein